MLKKLVIGSIIVFILVLAGYCIYEQGVWVLIKNLLEGVQIL